MLKGIRLGALGFGWGDAFSKFLDAGLEIEKKRVAGDIQSDILKQEAEIERYKAQGAGMTAMEMGKTVRTIGFAVAGIALTGAVIMMIAKKRKK